MESPLLRSRELTLLWTELIGYFGRLSVKDETDAQSFQTALNGIGNIPVFAGDKVGAVFQHGDHGAVVSIHGGKFQSNVAAANDDQPLGQRSQLHHSGAGINTVAALQAGYGRDDRLGAGIDKDFFTM